MLLGQPQKSWPESLVFAPEGGEVSDVLQAKGGGIKRDVAVTRLRVPRDMAGHNLRRDHVVVGEGNRTQLAGERGGVGQQRVGVVRKEAALGTPAPPLPENTSGNVGTKPHGLAGIVAEQRGENRAEHMPERHHREPVGHRVIILVNWPRRDGYDAAEARLGRMEIVAKPAERMADHRERAFGHAGEKPGARSLLVTRAPKRHCCLGLAHRACQRRAKVAVVIGEARQVVLRGQPAREVLVVAMRNARGPAEQDNAARRAVGREEGAGQAG